MMTDDLISNSSKLFKDIIIINKTDMNLKNIHFAYENSERPVLKISNLPKGQQIKKSLLVNYLEKPTKLLLIYNLNAEQEKSILAYNSIWHDDLSILILKIENDGDDLKVNYFVKDNSDNIN